MNIRHLRLTAAAIVASPGLTSLAPDAIAEQISRHEGVVVGEKVALYSETLDEERSILVGTPEDYADSDEAYPVLIVLDGDAHFHHTSALVSFLAENRRIPPMLVVSIENTIRPRDLTPPSGEPSDRESFPVHGGAAAFQAFIGDELIPWLESNYRTRPYRILIGHSHGGLFAIYSLVTRPELFQGYIAISPSLQWDGQRFVDRAATFLETQDELEASLFLTAGNEGGELLGGIRRLAAALDAGAPKRFDWAFEQFPHETHGTVPLRGTYSGIEFLFADWSLRDPLETYRKYGLDAVEAFYAAGDAKYGYSRGAPVNDLTVIARELIAAGDLDEAMLIIRRYRDIVSPPARVLVGIADQYRSRGRVDDAIGAYRMVLETGQTTDDPRQAAAVATAREALSALGADVEAPVRQ